MFFGLVAGLLLALTWPSAAASLQPIGTAFIEAIRMIIIPLIVSSVSLGTYKMGANIRQLGRVAVVSFSYFYFATFCAIVIALVLDGIVHPGIGAGLVPTGKIPPNLAVSIDWIKFLLDLIPSNIVAVMAAGRLLPTLVFAVLFGVALAGIGARARPVVDLLEAIMAAMFRLTQWIIALSPLAIFALMGFLFATQGLGAVLGLAKLIGLMYVGLAIEIAIFCVMLTAMGDRPLYVFRRILEPLLLAFTTRSSEVTLPVHMKILQEMGIPNKIVSVVLPLGYSFNQDGSILYQALAVTFMAEAYNVALDWPALLTILITVLIASKGGANIPSGSLVILATVLTAIGLPVEAIALVAGVDAFMDMGRTAVNVLGNTVATKLVTRFGGSAAHETA
ncbi:MAG: dicarboxylate/amino acid:cation symporter [Proteobacteria bacterium]|nr:dicarboxylate/amino acid:cation symporter [Pseudomonadota bacterium]MBI3498599.1 dicarboxylate/amino acid:cation symporter [Pseudomonadota bacterium]